MPGLLTHIYSPRARQKSRYSVRPFFWCILLFTTIATLNLVRASLRDEPAASTPTPLRRLARSYVDTLGPNGSEVECRMVRTVEDQCSFVRANCPNVDGGLFSYLQFYYCTFASAKPIAFTMLILWLSLLFSTIGIAASDFLCVDLSTLASILGLSESLTGVTFLAFGNGSPDVFSTFAAMKSNSGSLAIGELLGAASFITSVVAGSMALVRPFRVARRSFIRDVGYFVVAASFSIYFVADGRLYTWEAAAMVGLYTFYVAMVVTWHWYFTRQRHLRDRNAAARSLFHIPNNQELDVDEAPEDDDPNVAQEQRSLYGPSAEDFGILERSNQPAGMEGAEDDEICDLYLAEIRNNMHLYRSSTSRRRSTINPIRPSLVGALEFQSVLSSLQKSKSVPDAPSISLDRYLDIPVIRPQYQEEPGSHYTVSDQPDNMPAANAHPSDDLRFRSDAASDDGSDSESEDSYSVLEDDRMAPQLSNNTPCQRMENHGSYSDEMPAQVSSPRKSSQVLSPLKTGPFQDPGLLAPPDTFRSPNYRTGVETLRSPSQVSPRSSATFVSPFESPPPSPFPPYQDTPYSGASSIGVGDALSSSGSLVADGGPFGKRSYQRETVRWLPYKFSLSLLSLRSALFPTLEGWKAKSVWSRILSIVATPSVLLLTITVPVVEPEVISDVPPVVISQADDAEGLGALVRLSEDGPSIQAFDRQVPENQGLAVSNANSQGRSTAGRLRLDSELPVPLPSSLPAAQKGWSQWLVSIQLFTGPILITVITWVATGFEMNARNLLVPCLASILFSLVCFTCLVINTRHGHHFQPPGLWRPFLSLLGFVVAIFWIACIATEVVSLLKTLGVILNISDSLLGLTVFAVGNSLGDLVADITVARLGYPVMALSACFGGPMLNILLGVGLGGMYMTINPGTNAGLTSASDMAVATATARGLYEIEISRVLAISSASLLLTLIGLLIVVPLANWRMDRRIGWGLISLWVVSTLSSIIVEVLA